MKKKTVTITVLAVAIAAVVWWYFNSNRVWSPVKETLPPANEISLESDTTAAVAEDLNALDLADLESEFKVIDEELNNL